MPCPAAMPGILLARIKRNVMNPRANSHPEFLTDGLCEFQHEPSRPTAAKANAEPTSAAPLSCLVFGDMPSLRSSPAARVRGGNAGVLPRHGGGHAHVRRELPHDAQTERGVLRRVHCPRKVNERGACKKTTRLFTKILEFLASITL